MSSARANPPASEATTRRIDMDRRCCTVSPDRIDIRPSRGSILLPAAGLEVVLLKTSGRRLTVGAVTVPRSLATDGLDRARQVAEAIGGMAGKPMQVARPRRRRRRAARPNHIPSERRP